MGGSFVYTLPTTTCLNPPAGHPGTWSTPPALSQPGTMASNVGTDSNSSSLSLKLRTGSNGSRDSFYLDFDRGIDSDIEEVSAAHSCYLLGLEDYYVPKAEAEEVDVVVEAEEEGGGVKTGSDSTSVELQERKQLLTIRLDIVIGVLCWRVMPVCRGS